MKLAQCHPDKKHVAKGLCKSCYGKQHHKEHWPERYERDKEKIKARARDYWHSHRKLQPGERRRARARSRRQREENPEKMRTYHHEWYLRKSYGITVEQCRELFERNGGKCWICSNRTAERIDHNHETGKVRGALCHQCNVGIGHLNDDIGLLLKAIQYLKTGKVVTNAE